MAGLVDLLLQEPHGVEIPSFGAPTPANPQSMPNGRAVD